MRNAEQLGDLIVRLLPSAGLLICAFQKVLVSIVYTHINSCSKSGLLVRLQIQFNVTGASMHSDENEGQ